MNDLDQQSSPLWFQPIKVDDRKARRMPMPSQQTTAVLKIGRKRLVASLLDQSADGFSVLLPSAPKGLDEKKLVNLRTQSGWHQCEIIYRKQMKDGVRLGMKRTADLPDPRDPASRGLAQPKAQPTSPPWLWTALLVLVVVSGGLLAGMLWH